MRAFRMLDPVMLFNVWVPPPATESNLLKEDDGVLLTEDGGNLLLE